VLTLVVQFLVDVVSIWISFGIITICSDGVILSAIGLPTLEWVVVYLVLWILLRRQFYLSFVGSSWRAGCMASRCCSGFPMGWVCVFVVPLF
jgi:hypothetical protein